MPLIEYLVSDHMDGLEAFVDEVKKKTNTFFRLRTY